MVRRTQSDDYLGPSRGWARLMHRTVMFLLLPFRRPVWFLLILLILFLAPTFKGVKPAEVHLWYWNKIKTSSTEVGAIVAYKTKEMLPDLSNVELPSIKVTSTANKNAPAVKVVDMPVKEVRRKSFEKASGEVIPVDILQQNNIVRAPGVVAASAPRRVVRKTVQAAPVETETPADIKKKLALVYLDSPKTITGTAKVNNANELVFDNETVFLYGIYADPNTTQGQEAKIFLDKTIDGQPVECQITAYTYQGIATGICTTGKINLNRALVDNGYSKNVALDIE